MTPHDMTYRNSRTNDPSLNQLPMPYRFWDMAQKNFKGQGLQGKVKSWSYYDVAYPHLKPMSLASINFLHLTVFEI